jgi:hypothetical protein
MRFPTETAKTSKWSSYPNKAKAFNPGCVREVLAQIEAACCFLWLTWSTVALLWCHSPPGCSPKAQRRLYHSSQLGIELFWHPWPSGEWGGNPAFLDHQLLPKPNTHRFWTLDWLLSECTPLLRTSAFPQTLDSWTDTLALCGTAPAWTLAPTLRDCLHQAIFFLYKVKVVKDKPLISCAAHRDIPKPNPYI